MYVIHAIRRIFTCPYGNPLSAGTLFSGGSHMGTGAAVQYPSWGGVSPLHPARNDVPIFCATQFHAPISTLASRSR